MSDRDLALEFIVAAVVCGVVAVLLAAYRSSPVVTVVVGALALLSVGVAVFLRLRKDDPSKSHGQNLLLVGVLFAFVLGAAGFLWLAYCSCWE